MPRYFSFIFAIWLFACKEPNTRTESAFADTKKIYNITNLTEYPASDKMITGDSLFKNRCHRWLQRSNFDIAGLIRKRLGLNSIENDTATVSYRVMIDYSGWSGYNEDPISFTASKNGTDYELDICENKYCDNYRDTGLTSCITKKIYKIDSAKFYSFKKIIEENDLYNVPSFPFENCSFGSHEHRYYIEFNDGRKYKLLKLNRKNKSTILFALKLFKFLHYSPERIEHLEKALPYYDSKP